MRDKREVLGRESSRRGPRAAQDYDERTPRRKSKAGGSQDDRDRENPQSRHRSTAIRPQERERDPDSNSYYQGRYSPASKPISSEEARKAIRSLFVQVKETISFFAGFIEEYEVEIRGVEAYAGQEILKRLWNNKIEEKFSNKRSSKVPPKEDGPGSASGFDGATNQLWGTLSEAYEGAKAHPSGQNAGLAKKLETASKDLIRLFTRARIESHEMDSLIKELKLLKVLLELGGAGKKSHDDRASQRPRGQAASHGHQRDSHPRGEDARYGGMEEESESEDHGQLDEQHGEHEERSSGREERDDGGGGEGQGGDDWEH